MNRKKNDLTSSTGPLIVLLEMQRRNFLVSELNDCARLYDTLERYRGVMRLARLSAWPVAHVLRRDSSADSDPNEVDWHPIDGFEPIFCEMIYFTRGADALSNSHFATLLEQHRGRDILALGMSDTPGFEATLEAAGARGHHLTRLDLDTGEEQTGETDTILRTDPSPTSSHFLRRYVDNDLILRIAQV